MCVRCAFYWFQCKTFVFHKMSISSEAYIYIYIYICFPCVFHRFLRNTYVSVSFRLAPTQNYVFFMFSIHSNATLIFLCIFYKFPRNTCVFFLILHQFQCNTCVFLVFSIGSNATFVFCACSICSHATPVFSMCFL